MKTVSVIAKAIPETKMKAKAKSQFGISILSLLLMITSACVDIQGPEMEAFPDKDILARIRIRSDAIMIAKGDSQKIAFDIVSMTKDSIPFDPHNIKWSTEEAQIVSVSRDGVIYGRDTSEGPVRIHVAYEHNHVTRYDTVSVYVTSGVIDANSLRLISLDSTRIGASAVNPPRVRIDLYKDGGLVKKGAIIPVKIDEPAVASVDQSGGLDGEAVYRITNNNFLIGKFWIRASLNLYGSEVSDSIQFTGLYGSFITPLGFISTVSPGQQIPLLDTIPLGQYQLCALYAVLNFSPDPVDVLFSDSTASSSGCDAGDISLVEVFGLPIHGIFIGGNVYNMPPNTIIVRRSNTAGRIVWSVRNSITKKLIPEFTSHFRQVDVQD